MHTKQAFSMRLLLVSHLNFNEWLKIEKLNWKKSNWKHSVLFHVKNQLNWVTENLDNLNIKNVLVLFFVRIWPWDKVFCWENKSRTAEDCIKASFRKVLNQQLYFQPMLNPFEFSGLNLSLSKEQIMNWGLTASILWIAMA